MTTDQQAPTGHRAAHAGGSARRPGRRPGRRAVVVSAAAAVALTAGALTGVQVRAAQAQDERDTVAAEAAAERSADAAAENAATRAAAAERLAVAWEQATARADAALAAAQPVLDASAGQVADDGVRLALALAMDVVEAQRAGDGLASSLEHAVTALAGATDAVTVAQAAWLAEQEAAAAAAAEAAAQQAATSSARRSGGGAGADCGGTGSYEPPVDDGRPVFYTSTPTAAGDGSNGNVPASAMTPLSWCQDSAGNQQWLRSDAAAALTGLNEAFRAQFGENIAVDMSYRSYADQVAMRAYYGGIAAQPGTSNHGLGTAIDTWEWSEYSFGSARYEWLVATGPAYGWVAPSWARAGGSNPEYWHFEYTG